jgi:vitamin-K-epoxide reductase (warfarin-sensitive)
MRYLLALVAIAGAVVSTLALQVHYATGTLPCSINEKWDCGIVNHSSFAVIGNVPVAALGILGYVVLCVLALMRQRLPLMLVAFAGFCFALRLTMIEQYALGVWCLYCVYSQGIISLLLLLAVAWHIAEYVRLRRVVSQVPTSFTESKRD